MRKRRVSHSPYLEESKRKRKKIFIKRAVVCSLFFLIIFIGLALLSRWNKLNIENIEIAGNKVTDSFAVETVIRDELAGHYVWFFPKANFFIYPRKEIEIDLANKFKIFKNISVNLKGIKTLSINVSEREGKYTWCGDSLPVEVGAPYKCYFMDASGYVFDEAPYFSGDVYLKFFGKGELGENFYPDLFPKLLAFRNDIEKLEIKIPSLYVKDDNTVEFYLSSNKPFDALLSGAPKIIAESNSDFGKMIENLQTALSTEPLQTDFKKKYSSLDSIDLRFGNKVYYKFK